MTPRSRAAAGTPGRRRSTCDWRCSTRPRSDMSATSTRARARSRSLRSIARAYPMSPTSSAVGLTSATLGAQPGEPQKYYPTGIRTFARVVPNDRIQAIAQVRVQQEMGCTATYVLTDGEVDGSDAARSFEVAAQAAHLRLAGDPDVRPRRHQLQGARGGDRAVAPDCMLIAADTESGAALLTTDLAAAMPTVKIFGTAGLAESTFANPAHGGIPASVDPRVVLTVADAGAERIPAVRARVQRRVRAPIRATPTRRDLRLRGDEPDARRDQASDRRRHRACRALAGAERYLRHPRSPQRARYLQHRPRRRHDACSATGCTESSTAS